MLAVTALHEFLPLLFRCSFVTETLMTPDIGLIPAIAGNEMYSYVVLYIVVNMFSLLLQI